MTLVRLEPAAPQSQVKHSTTELPTFSIGIGVIHLCDISGHTWFIKVCSVSDNTIKPVLNGHSKIDKQRS